MSITKHLNAYHSLGLEWNKLNHDLTHCSKPKRNVKNVQNRNMTDLHNKTLRCALRFHFINMSFFMEGFVFPLTSFQWLVHYRHIHMNKYKSKNKVNCHSVSLSTLKCSDEQVLISKLTQRKENNDLQKSEMCVCVCTAANDDVQQVFLYTCMRADPCCAAVLVVVAGWNVHSKCWCWVNSITGTKSIWCSTEGWGREWQWLIKLSAICFK